VPFPNESSCRIKEPGNFQKGSFRRISQKSGGKVFYIIIGRLKGKTTTTAQAYRYPIKGWTIAQARSHCSEHDGRFEAAGGD
jgi:hypothetical protein